MIYFSKQLDSVATRRILCLTEIATAALLVEEITQVTLDNHLEVQTPHEAKGVQEIGAFSKIFL